MTRTNYLGGVWCLRAFLPALEAAAPSDVVNVVSVAGTVAAGSSGPVHRLEARAARVLALDSRSELRPRGIRVHTILPGFVETDGLPAARALRPAASATLVVEPELVAERLLDAVEHDRREVFVPALVPDRAAGPGARARARRAGRPRVEFGPQATRIPAWPIRSPPPRPFPVAEFRAALRAFMRTSERNARAAGLTPQRYLLLLMIKGAPDGSEQSTVTELAERLQLAQSTVTELVSRAEEIGLVERERSHDDGRIAFLRLTAEGERRLAASFTSNERERQALRQGVRASPGDRAADVGFGRARRDPLLPHLKRLRREGRESRDRAHRRRLRGRGDPG